VRSADLHIRIPDIRSAHYRQVDWRDQTGSRGSDGLRVGSAAPRERQHGECKNDCRSRCRNHDGQVQTVGFALEKGDGAKENWRRERDETEHWVIRTPVFTRE
jgi:hypothetical protein